MNNVAENINRTWLLQNDTDFPGIPDAYSVFRKGGFSHIVDSTEGLVLATWSNIESRSRMFVRFNGPNCTRATSALHNELYLSLFMRMFSP
ncbi:hypothetical protein ACVBGC_00445 [Burkholderia stagnalis]